MRSLAGMLVVVTIMATSLGAHADTVDGTSGASGSSQVEMYGLLGMYVDSAKLSTAKQSTVQMGGGGMTTSYWGIRGREDLGDGNAVIFSLESFFRPNTGQMGRNTTDRKSTV